MKLKVSEIFYSIQGEGVYMGVPSVFLRTFGCNFQCRGFGLPRGEVTDEPEEIAKRMERMVVRSNDKIRYEDLPLAKHGCDSYAAWHPDFKHLSPFMNSDEVVDKIYSLLPHREFRQEHLIFTGGEPLLGWQRAYAEMIEHMPDLQYITFETNGTQPLHQSLKDLFDARDDLNVLFSVSAKLSASGEKFDDAIKPEIVDEYQMYGDVAFKFVVDKEQDIEEIQKALRAYYQAGVSPDTPVYLMPVGGTLDSYNEHSRAVAELAMKLGYRYSDRLQVPLFKNAWGT